MKPLPLCSVVPISTSPLLLEEAEILSGMYPGGGWLLPDPGQVSGGWTRLPGVATPCSPRPALLRRHCRPPSFSLCSVLALFDWHLCFTLQKR